MQIKKWTILALLALFVLSAACTAAPQEPDDTGLFGTDTGETGGLGGEPAGTDVLDSPSDALGTPTVETMEETSAPPTAAITEPVEGAATEPVEEEATGAPTAAGTEDPAETGGAGTAACATGLTVDEMMTTGEEIYTNTCAACHGPEGQGAGSFPPLAGRSSVTAEDATETILVFLDPTVHPFITQFDGNDLAAVMTYVRMSFGNEAPALCPEDIESLTGGQ